MNFDNFVRETADRTFGASMWIREPGISIYVRKTPVSLRDRYGDYQLANLSANVPGKGALTAFLDQYEPFHRFYIENILEPRLIPYFKRRGYTERNYPTCMIGPTK